MHIYAAIVVTYNRKALLKENIEALLSQSYTEFDILIIDNASTDDTESLVHSYTDDRVLYFNTEKNIGGAGGFNFGLKRAFERKYTYCWLMDDDAIPERTAFESLLRKATYINSEFSFLASLVYWTDGKIFPMNAPNCNYNHVVDVEYDMIRNYKLVPIRTCSFVGCFVNMNIAKQTELPIADFFIYGDDVEYTERLRLLQRAYLDLDSIIIHKASSNKGADIATVASDRLNRFVFQFRNGIYIAKKNHVLLQQLIRDAYSIIRVIRFSVDKKAIRCLIILRGIINGLFFHPKLEQVML